MNKLEKITLAGTLSLAAVMGGCAFEAPEPEEVKAAEYREALKRAKPQISYVYVPAFGERGHLVGKVDNADTKQHKVITYIEVRSEWWIKPAWDEQFTRIRDDGMFEVDIVTGGEDKYATRVYSAVVKENYQPSKVRWGIGEEFLPNAQEDEDVITEIKASKPRREKK